MEGVTTEEKLVDIGGVILSETAGRRTDELSTEMYRKLDRLRAE